MVKDKIQLHENQTLGDRMNEIKSKLFEIIDKELDKSISICLIVNLWEKNHKLILAISASYSNKYYLNNVIFLDIKIKNNGNSVELWIKESIEEILFGNIFKFKKDLIKGKLNFNFLFFIRLFLEYFSND